MSLPLRRLMLPRLPVTSSAFRIISPSVRTATAFANKMDSNLPLKDMPHLKKTGSLTNDKVRTKSKNKAPTKDRYDSPPVPLDVPTMQEQKPSEPYFIHRTPTRNLPIYELTKDGGNLRQTRVRKLEGQITILKQQLETVLDPKPEWIRINPVNSHVEMKGWYKAQIQKFLTERGF